MKKWVIQKFIYQLTRVLILGWFISGSIRLTNHEILVDELSLIEPILSPGATIMILS